MGETTSKRDSAMDATLLDWDDETIEGLYILQRREGDDVAAFVAAAIRIGMNHGLLDWTPVFFGSGSVPSKKSLTMRPALIAAMTDNGSTRGGTDAR